VVKQQEHSKRNVATKKVLIPPARARDLKHKPQQEGSYFRKRKLLTGKSTSTGASECANTSPGSVGARLHCRYAADEDAMNGTTLPLLYVVRAAGAGGLVIEAAPPWNLTIIV
jgi:hypothetical protein